VKLILPLVKEKVIKFEEEIIPCEGDLLLSRRLIEYQFLELE